MSNDIAIRVENLSKRYRIGLRQDNPDTLIGALGGAVRRPLANLRRLRGLTRFDDVPRPTGNEEPRIKCEAPITINDSPAIKNEARSTHNQERITCQQDTLPGEPVDVLWALKDVSFEVRRGEVLGVIGRNGAGKSTLLKILSRITEPSTGRVELCGRVSSLLEVGTGFHPELTGRENVYLNGTILGMSKLEINDKFEEIVDFSGVERFIDTPVKRYSSGMRVRLAFSVAAYLEPEILLIDEVLAVGDAGFQKKCLGKMEDAAHEGRTVLFVSHNMFAVQGLCSRAILLESGGVVEDGGVGEVVGTYLAVGPDEAGEVCWDSESLAPGDGRLRLRAVRVRSDGVVKPTVDIDKDFQIEVDYWNLEGGGRRLVSVHLHNAKGVCILTSGNMRSTSVKLDPWCTRRYPLGLFRTSCTIPGFLLNDGVHSVTLYINERGANDNLLHMRDVLSFTVLDTGAMREEYLGEWLGAVRPRLEWRTTQIDSVALA